LRPGPATTRPDSGGAGSPVNGNLPRLPGAGRRWAPQQFLLPQGHRSPNFDGADIRILNAFSAASGGHSWLISSSEGRARQIKDALDTIACELRSQYTIGYYPGHPLDDGKWHQVDVKTRNPLHEVRAKKEYFAKPASQ
jgi:VWFA-related protein